MGYTHYWDRSEKLDKGIFAKAVADCEEICAVIEVPIAEEYNKVNSCPVFNPAEIRFNGIGDNGHETFLIRVTEKKVEWRKNEELVFTFCKTAQKPYDLNVTACLIVFKHHFGEIFSVSSDGDSSEWQAARDICQKTLGYGENFKFDEDD